MISAKLGTTSYTTPNDHDIVITRVFDAPREFLFDAWTDPALIRQWMTGPDGWTMPVCEIDLRPGGAWRYVYRKDGGSEMTLTGTVKEARRPERFVSTERWGPEWPESTNTIEFAESNGQTTITFTITYTSKEVRDAALATGMKSGVDASFNRLDDVIADQP